MAAADKKASLTLRKGGTTATMRLKQDYLRIQRDPVPFVTAHPQPSNILEWHYVVRGPEKTPYEGGIYHGRLSFPSEFPFKPPAIFMVTPSGRFKPNTRLCLSISDYHPDTWNPAWSVSTILTGLLSFMVETDRTSGSIETTDFEKKVLAKQSHEFNLRNKMFVQLFPEIVEEVKEKRKLTMDIVTDKVTDLTNQIKSRNIRNGHGADGHNDAGGIFNSLWSTLAVISVFVAFLFTAKYVVNLNSNTS